MGKLEELVLRELDIFRRKFYESSFSHLPILKVDVLVAHLCLTLGNSMDYSLPGSSIQGFSRQEYWSRLPFPSPGDLPDPGIEPRSPALWEDALPSEPPGKSCHTQKSTKTINQNVCSSQTVGIFYQDVSLTVCIPLIKLTYNGLPHYFFGTVLRAR